jgi:transcriptional regulator with XRE-family HTH domain
MAEKLQQKWTEAQIKYINFVARGRRNKRGEKKSEEQFAKALGVDRTTLWRWTQLEGFGEALFLATQKELQPLLPALSRAVSGKAFGQDKFKKIDIPAANLAIKLMGVTLEKRETKVQADIKGEMTHEHSFAGMSDEDLQKIIQGES